MMKHSKSCAAVLTALVAAGYAQFSSAQTEAPVTRAEVKAETRRAEKEHHLVPAGEGTTPVPAPSKRSTKTRAQRKAETIAARNAGEVLPAGDAAVLKQDRDAKSLKSTKTRAQRKAETLAAEKAKQLTPAGEAAGAK